MTAVERFAQLYGQVATRPADAFFGAAERLIFPDPEQVPPERLRTAATLFEAAAGFIAPDSEHGRRVFGMPPSSGIGCVPTPVTSMI